MSILASLRDSFVRLVLAHQTMSFDTIAAAVATLLSATLATMILARGWGTRRAHLLAWGTSLGLFAVGSATLTFGSATSWTPALFRLYYAAGAVVTAPLREPVAPDVVPEGKDLFGAWPRTLAVVGNVVGTILVVGGTVRSILRVASRRHRGIEADRRMLQANLLITLGVVVAGSGGAFLGFGEAASKAIPLALAASLIFLGYMRSQPARPAQMAP